MQRFFSSFPAGRAGVGLLLLRLAAAASLLSFARHWLASPAWPAIAIGALAAIVALLLLTGFATPIAGCAAVAAGVYSGAAAGACLVVIAAAIVLTGPGAFSVDARLFGRRQILL